MTLMSRSVNRAQAPTQPVVPPPEGATAASFVFFGALAALLAIIYAGSEWVHTDGQFGFPTDAAWTRLVFARNLAEGRGLCFNPDIPAAGATGPAWLGLLAGVGYLLNDFVGAAKLLGAIAVILTAYLVWAILLHLLGDWRFAFVGALATVAAPHFQVAALSGTEGALGGLLVAATIHWQGGSWDGFRRQRLALVLAAGLALLTRPELILLLPLMLLDRGLVAAVGRPPRGARAARGRAHAIASALFLQGLPEAIGAGLLAVPYLLYNWRTNDVLWQQPDLALRAQSSFAWAMATLRLLWQSNPALACISPLGLPVAALSAVRSRSSHPSFLLPLLPLALLLIPGFLWKSASPANATYTAACLTPALTTLAAGGLFLLYRAVRGIALQRGSRVARLFFVLGLGAAIAGLLASAYLSHRDAWAHYGMAVKKVSYLQGAVGRWAAQHLSPDASIASREVGAIGFYSRRRMIDLGGTIDRAGYLALARPGLVDDHLLAFLEKTRPSHVAIRPADFPYLSQRSDILVPVITCLATDQLTGGATTMTLYETPWRPPSLRALPSASASR